MDCRLDINNEVEYDMEELLEFGVGKSVRDSYREAFLDNESFVDRLDVYGNKDL